MESASIDIDKAWNEHAMAMHALSEQAESVDHQIQRLITTVKAYRCHKIRTNGPQSCDYGLIAELCLEIEKVMRLP